MRPEFWTDERMAGLSPAVRLFYIGLWNVADDLGWMEWRPARIGAVLFPYESPKRRQRDIETWATALTEAGRLVVHDCGCAQVPTLSKHQRVSGKQSFTAFDAHKGHGMRPKPRVPTTRDLALERDGYACRFCGSEVTDRTLVLAHVDPRGLADIDNLVIGCRRCNIKQGSQSLAEAGMSLLPVPVAPNRYRSDTDSPVEVGNGTLGNGMSRDELFATRDAEDDADRVKLAASKALRH